MTATAVLRRARQAAALVVVLASLSACSGGGEGAPAWTAQATASDSPASASATPGATGGSTDTPSGGSSPSTPAPGSGPAPGATASAWKDFADPGKNVSFELPQEWIAQSVAVDEGSLPGALKIEVKDAKGNYVATLQTGMPEAAAPACPEGERKPYTVVSSVPVDLPHKDGEGTIAPRVVFRVIQGYKFFGSYGITNQVGGADGKACGLQNVVLGPEGKGSYWFGDLRTLKAFAVDEKVAPAKAFDTLDQAAKYVSEGSEFANVQRMLMSLEIKS